MHKENNSHNTCVFTWENIHTIEWFIGAGCEISHTQWVPTCHCVGYCSTQIKLLFLTCHHFNDPFFHLSTQWRAMVSMTCSLRGEAHSFWKPEGVTWPAERQAARVEKLKLNDSRLIPFSPDAHVGLRAPLSQLVTDKYDSEWTQKSCF